MPSTTVLITGANRGLGRALAEAYLSRPDHVVIAAVRDDTSESSSSLKAIKPASSSSRVIVVKIANDSETDAAAAVDTIKAAGISSLDVVIANAAIANVFARLEEIDMKDFQQFFEVNTYGPMRLYIAVYPLLKAAADNGGKPKFVAISTVASRIMKLEENAPFKLGAYGASKVAVNYIVRRAHAENEWLEAFLLEPGLINTDMGKEGIRPFGLPETILTKVGDSCAGIMKLIDESTREKTSGKFFNWEGVDQGF
ncbi:Nor-1 [Nemania sp. FL0916]|nr:Nor-1 [Nemania sp. FL0916]